MPKKILNLFISIILAMILGTTITSCSNESNEQVEIQYLLNEAERLFKMEQFTIPDGANSYDKLLMVLSYDSNNARAQEGIQAILDWYLNQMHKAQKDSNWRKVNEYSKRALSIDKNHSMARKMFRLAQKELYPNGHNHSSTFGDSHQEKIYQHLD